MTVKPILICNVHITSKGEARHFLLEILELGKCFASQLGFALHHRFYLRANSIFLRNSLQWFMDMNSPKEFKLHFREDAVHSLLTTPSAVLAELDFPGNES